jgi:hypothetical protein
MKKRKSDPSRSHVKKNWHDKQNGRNRSSFIGCEKNERHGNNDWRLDDA